MQLPLNDIIERIKENSTLSQEDIEERIKKKSEQLSGLISKEGAAQIIANELGIKLFQLDGPVKINKIVSGMRTVETVGKITRIFDVNTFNKSDGTPGKVGSFTMGDETGRIRVTFWNELTDKLSMFKEGDVVKIKEAMARSNNNRVELHMTSRSSFVLNPDGETIGEVKEYMSNRKKINTLVEGDVNVEILGTIVQVFEPRFFEICPECNRRARPRDGKFYCNEHNEVVPNFSYVMNAQLDDGSGNIRGVFFKNQAKILMGKEDSEILMFKEDISGFADVKQELLGNFVKIVGRVSKNTMFDRLEFVSQLVFTNPDPSEELKKVN